MPIRPAPARFAARVLRSSKPLRAGILTRMARFGHAAALFLLVLAAAHCSKPASTSGAPLPGSTSASPTSRDGRPLSSIDHDAPTGPPTEGGEVGCGGGRSLTVHFYDVGQALAALVDLPGGRHILVDAGDSPARPRCGNACADNDRHLLRGLGDDLHGTPIDLLWITHQHSDHIGGAPEVLETFKVGTYVDNGRDDRKSEVVRAHRAAEKRGTTARVVDPDHPQVPFADAPDVRVTPILPAAWPPRCSHDPNECSIALRIDFCASSVLFTGDAEHDEEAMLDPRGSVTLLQVAHHGSDTSTTPGFLMKVRPKYAVISAGKPDESVNTTYCHPRALIVKRLTTLAGGPGAKTLKSFDGDRCANAVPSDWVDVPTSDRLWATERDGDVVLTTTGDGNFTRQAPRAAP